MSKHRRWFDVSGIRYGEECWCSFKRDHWIDEKPPVKKNRVLKQRPFHTPELVALRNYIDPATGKEWDQ